MPGLAPGIHVFGFRAMKDVDGRVKPGHDDLRNMEESCALIASPVCRLIRFR
jgi:hypothetical protein